MTPTILLIPGYLNSAPGHWQSLWEEENPEFRRVVQRNWETPDRQEWVQTIDQAIRASNAPVVLVGHSCGSVAIALWGEWWEAQWEVQHNPCPVMAALLVAPADCEAADAIPAIKPLAPMPRVKLPFPSLVVASSNDPYIRLSRAQELACCWGSHLKVLEGAGHITTDSGYGHWAEGKQLLWDLMGNGA